MGFKEVASLDADVTIALGGKNKKTNKPNPSSAEGYYLGSREVDSKKSKNGKAFIHFLQTKSGNVGIWGKTDLDRKVTTITPGTMVRLSFDKMVPTPNGDMYKYRVEQDSEDTIEVGDLSSASAPAASEESEEAESYESSEDTGEAEATEEELAELEAQEQAAAARRAKVAALLNKGGAKGAVKTK
jgi:hypothetical protein